VNQVFFFLTGSSRFQSERTEFAEKSRTPQSRPYFVGVIH